MAKENNNPVVSLIMGIVLTIILVVVVPVIISYFLEPIVKDLIEGSSDGDAILGISTGAVSAIVMFVILVLFMLLLGGGKILKKYGVIGIVGLIIAYEFILKLHLGWVIPVAIVVLLGIISYMRDKKK
jgi:hypothetical protein